VLTKGEMAEENYRPNGGKPIIRRQKRKRLRGVKLYNLNITFKAEILRARVFGIFIER
jgi:hypothetical protein